MICSYQDERLEPSYYRYPWFKPSPDGEFYTTFLKVQSMMIITTLLIKMFQTIWVLNLSFKATKLKTNEWEKFFQKIDWFGVKPMLTIPLESKVCEKGEIKTLPFPLWPFLDICLCLVLRIVKMIYNGKFKKKSKFKLHFWWICRIYPKWKSKVHIFPISVLEKEEVFLVLTVLCAI